MRGMDFGISECKCGPPRATKYQPGFYAEFLSQRFHIRDQMGRGVVGQIAVRGGATTTALVKQNDPVACGVKKTSLAGRGA